MSSIMSVYSTWEQKKMKEYDVFVSKYSAIKEQEGAISQQNMSKLQKKDLLLNMKENNTITREGNAELEYIDREFNVESEYNRNINVIERSKERKLKDARAVFESTVAKAQAILDRLSEKIEDDYDTALRYYNGQQETSLSKAKREYEQKKRTFELQKNRVEGERAISSKTATQLTIEKQKRAVLKEMKNIIDVINMTRNNLTEKNPVFIFDVPELPEPLTDEYIPVIAQTPLKPVRPFPSEAQWMAMGEDPELKSLRENELAKQKRVQHSDRPDVVTRYGDISDLEGRDSKPAYYLMNMIPPNRDEETLPEVQEEQEDDGDDWSDLDEEYINKRKEEMKSVLKVR